MARLELYIYRIQTARAVNHRCTALAGGGKYDQQWGGVRGSGNETEMKGNKVEMVEIW